MIRVSLEGYKRARVVYRVATIVGVDGVMDGLLSLLHPTAGLDQASKYKGNTDSSNTDQRYDSH